MARVASQTGSTGGTTASGLDLWFKPAKRTFNPISNDDESGTARKHAVFVADMDGDGDMDILGASRGNNTIAWFENTGGLSFPQHTITTTNMEAHGVIAADVDGDGDLDVVSASKFGNRLAWYENVADPRPLTVTFSSTIPALSSHSTIPVTVSFSGPVTEFTAERLMIRNGTASNFAGSGSRYTFDLNADAEGTVTVELPAGTLTDISGHRNQAAIFSREFTIELPMLALPDGPSTFVRNGVPIRVVPNLNVSGSRVGGGTLVVSMNTINTKTKKLDVFNDTVLDSLGVLNRETVSGKWVTTVKLGSATDADSIQAALRMMTFSTSKRGLHIPTRELRIQLIDNSGLATVSVSQLVRVQRTKTRIQ